jgi:hypothetical protein
VELHKNNKQPQSDKIHMLVYRMSNSCLVLCNFGVSHVEVVMFCNFGVSNVEFVFLNTFGVKCRIHDVGFSILVYQMSNSICCLHFCCASTSANANTDAGASAGAETIRSQASSWGPNREIKR